MSYYETIALLIAILGWPISSYFANRWGIHSQKLQREYLAKSASQDRKRQFLSFLKEWQATVNGEWPPKKDMGPELQRHAALVCTDFSDPEFDNLVQAAFALTGAGAEKQNA
jgi:hypothetical protein